jgi:hypothetical protein
VIRHEDRTFTNEIIPLDGHAYVGCTFRGCRFVYAGGEYELRACRYDGCRPWPVDRTRGYTTTFRTPQHRKGVRHVAQQVIALMRGEVEAP